MFGLWRYSEEWDADASYPFKNGWIEANALSSLLITMLSIGTGIMLAGAFLVQPFLAIFFLIIAGFIYWRLRKLQMRIQEISETT